MGGVPAVMENPLFLHPSLLLGMGRGENCPRISPSMHLPYIFISIAWHGNYCLKHDWYKFSIHRKTVKYGVEEETKECYILAQRNVSFLSFLFDDIPNIF